MTLRQKNNLGQSIIELLVVIGLASIILPTIFMGVMSSQEGRAQQRSRMQALSLLREAQDATRSYRDNDWASFAVDGTYHPGQTNNAWVLLPNSEIINGYTRQIVIADTYRDVNGVASTSGTLDKSTKLVTITVSWTNTFPSSVQSQMYLTRHDNLAHIQTTTTDFNNDNLIQTQTTTTVDGEVKLGNNNRARWCSPAITKDSNGNEVTINLPDGPPVAVAATVSATTSIPNDVFVATAPQTSSTVKMAYVTVSANTDIPATTLKGIFTMDQAQYSAGTFPSGANLDNNFKTNDIKYYKEANGKIYALLATNLPDKEIIVVQINDGSADAYQDPVNKIYKYWTYFNTIPYAGSGSNDQAPYGYGASSLAILGTKGYMSSGGYLYVFDLSNIDSKTPASGLDMVGCRIELDGDDCQPGSPDGHVTKYTAGTNPISTGTNWATPTKSNHNDCEDGGNVELYATEDIYPIKVGSSTYVYVAVGANTDPEFEIINITTIPTSSSNPKIDNRYCGNINNDNNSGWKRISSYDFNSANGTEESANSVYAKSDGTRAYVSSNGGVDANHDGQPDSKQLYIINTSNKTSLSVTASYAGDSTQIQTFPRRSLTVLNGLRVVLVGKDGFPSPDIIDPNEYQVVKLEPETSPSYCGGVNFDSGFNDLTSVSEADGDNFVYMVANTMDHQLKIIQGGPDVGMYYDSGTIESTRFDANKATAFNSFYATAENRNPPNTDIQFQVAVGGDDAANCATFDYKFIGPDGTENTKFATTSAAIPLLGPTGYQNPGRCFAYKAYFSTQDTNQTPILDDFTVNYSP